jgi:hypothetical protein
MSGAVFVSAAGADSTLIEPLVADIVERDLEKAIVAGQLSTSGAPLEDDMFPTAIFGDSHSTHMAGLPHLFQANGYWCVSEPAHDVLVKADLGASRMRRVAVFQRDRVTPLADRFFCLAIAGTKACLLPEASIGLRPNPYARVPAYNLPWVPTDGAVAVTTSALEGADIWIDPALQRVFFVSRSLGSALADAGLAEAFRLHACTIVERSAGR